MQVLEALLATAASSRNREIEAYYAAGLRPDEVRTWRQVGIGPEQAAIFAANDIDPELALEMLRKRGELETEITGMQEWLKAGFDRESASEWIAAGFDIDTAREWRPVLRNERKLLNVRSLIPSLLPEESNIACLGLWRDAGISDPRAALFDADASVASSRYGRSYRSNQQPPPEIETWARALKFSSGEQALELARSSSATDTATRLVASGMDPRRAVHFAAHTDGIGAAEIIDYCKSGSDLTASDLNELHSSGVRPNDLPDWLRAAAAVSSDRGSRSSAHSKINAIVACSGAGLEIDAAKPWMRVLIANPTSIGRGETIKRLIDCGVTADQLGNYCNAKSNDRGYNRRTAKRLADWVEAGEDAAQLQLWEQSGKRTSAMSVGNLLKLAATGMNKEDLDGWLADTNHSYYWGDLDEGLLSEIKGYVDRKITVDDATRLRDSYREILSSTGRKSLTNNLGSRPLVAGIDSWTKSGMTLDDAIEWWPKTAPEVELGEAATVASSWQKLGFDLGEATEWQRGTMKDRPAAVRPSLAASFRDRGLSVRQATGWLKAGFDGAEAERWRQAGVSRATVATRLKNEGIDPDSMAELSEFKEFGLTPAIAASWKDAGFTAQQARDWSKAGCADPVSATAWREAGVPAEKAGEFERTRAKLRA